MEIEAILVSVEGTDDVVVVDINLPSGKVIRFLRSAPMIA